MQTGKLANVLLTLQIFENVKQLKHYTLHSTRTQETVHLRNITMLTHKRCSDIKPPNFILTNYIKSVEGK